MMATVLTPYEAAGALLVVLCRAGAAFSIDRDGLVAVDLDAVLFPLGDCTRSDVEQAITAYRFELAAILTRETVH
jgi:hypothetical protein